MTEQVLPVFSLNPGCCHFCPCAMWWYIRHLVIPLFVGRPKSVKALELASEHNKQILLVAQKSPNNDDPDASDLYNVGTIATVLQMLKLPDGTVKVLVEGVHRAKVTEFIETSECFAAKARALKIRQMKTAKLKV